MCDFFSLKNFRHGIHTAFRKWTSVQLMMLRRAEMCHSADVKLLQSPQIRHRDNMHRFKDTGDIKKRLRNYRTTFVSTEKKDIKKVMKINQISLRIRCENDFWFEKTEKSVSRINDLTSEVGQQHEHFKNMNFSLWRKIFRCGCSIHMKERPCSVCAILIHPRSPKQLAMYLFAQPQVTPRIGVACNTS